MTNEAGLHELFDVVDKIFLPGAVAGWIARLVEATHPASDAATSKVRDYVKHGASPRAAIALAEASRAHALLSGKPNVGFDDVRELAVPTVAHRLVLDYRARLDGVTAAENRRGPRSRPLRGRSRSRGGRRCGGVLMSGGSLRLPHRLFALLLALAACGLTSQTSLAQYREESDVVGKVSIRTWQRWPQAASRGWMPIFVELNNGSEREERVQVSASAGNMSSGGVSTTVVLSRGESRRVELVVPLVGGYDWRSSFAYTVRVAAAGETSRQYNFGAIGSSVNGSRPVMVFGPELPEAGLPESWTASLSTLVLEDLDPWPGMHLGGPATTVVQEETEVTSGGNNVPLVAGTFDEMPQRMDAYSSLSGVVLTHPRRIEAGKNLEELFAWTRVGGYLT
ncbi:MAG: hypothetical protein AAF368_16090, partial [Planctomycetota bacterium]